MAESQPAWAHSLASRAEPLPRSVGARELTSAWARVGSPRRVSRVGVDGCPEVSPESAMAHARRGTTARHRNRTWTPMQYLIADRLLVLLLLVLVLVLLLVLVL